MSQRRGNWNNRAEGSPSAGRRGARLWRQLSPSLFVAVTVLVALMLTAQEAELVAGISATPTSYVLPPTTTRQAATATAIATPSPTTEQPTPEATATARPSLTPTRSRPAAPACVKRQDWLGYTIQPGDTLSSIAVRVGVSVQQIKSGNCLRQDRIYAGETLLLPSLPYVTPIPQPTRKPPRPTRTPTQAPTATAEQTPGPTPTVTDTSEPEPTIPPTSTDPPTKPPAPPTATPLLPTKTPVPPTATAIPTNTPLPPTATPVSTD